MVKLTKIRDCNERFASEQNAGFVCVFAGATSGIGAKTLEKMTVLLSGSTFYVLGRSAARFESQHTRLRSLNPGCRFVFLEAELSLLSDVDAVCEKIIATEHKLDFLYMSPGLFPLNGPHYTKEGLEISFALSYYSRMRFIWNLLPLLRQSPRPRILSVLNGGNEKPMRDEDIGLDQHWSTFAVINHTVTMTSLAFEYLASTDKQITFLHAAPGLVRTDIFARLTAPDSSGVIWRVALALIHGLAAIMMLILGISPSVSGERQAYHLTSDEFNPGAWRITASSDKVCESGVLGRYREKGWSEKVWDHTSRVFDRALAGERD